MEINTRLTNDAVSQLHSIAVSARNRLDQELRERQRDIENITKSIDLYTLDENGWRKLIDATYRSYPDYSWLALVAPDGMVRIGNKGLLEGQSVAARPWFAPSLKAPYIGDVHDAVLLGKILGPDAEGQAPRFVDFAFPIRDAGGELIGVLGAHLNWSWARGALAPFEVADDKGVVRDALILDKDGIVLHGPLALLGRSLGIVLPREEVVKGVGADGHIYAAARSRGHGDFSGLGWTVVIRSPASRVYALTDTVRVGVMWAGIPAVVVFLLMTILVSRRIAAPVERLIQAVVGNEDIPAITTYREVAELSRAFAGLLEGLRHNQERIEAEVVARTNELHHFLRAIDSHAIVSMSDGDGTITYANDLFCEISGYTREELLGNNHSMLKSGRHDDAFYDEMWTAILNGIVWQGTICNRAKNGTEYWVRSTITPTSDPTAAHRLIVPALVLNLRL
jgi:PAS domain S-box-containing protein